MCGVGGKALWLALAVSLALHVLAALTGIPGLSNKPGMHEEAGNHSQVLGARLVGVSSGGGESSSRNDPLPAALPAAHAETGSGLSINPETAKVVADAQARALQSSQPSSPVSLKASETGEDTDAFSAYVAADTLDIIPTPVTAPDAHALNGMQFRENEVLIRLYVDATGVVRHVAVDVPEGEQEASQPLKTMFEQTAFVPGRKDGKAVASVLAIQINVQELGAVRYFSNTP